MQVHGQAMHPAAPGRLTTRRTWPRGLSRRDDQAEMAVVHGAHYRPPARPAAGRLIVPGRRGAPLSSVSLRRFLLLSYRGLEACVDPEESMIPALLRDVQVPGHRHDLGHDVAGRMDESEPAAGRPLPHTESRHD